MTTAAPVSAPPIPRSLFPPRHHRRYYIQTLLSRSIRDVFAKWWTDRADLTLVDYGCGSMPYRPLLAPYTKQYLGADIADNDEAEVAIRDADGRVDQPDDTADAVVSFQVLEHVADPAAYLAECRRLLKPGGRLVLTTHGTWWYHPHPTDFWRWTGEGLRRIVEEAGFEILEFRGLMGLAATGVHLFQDGTYRRIPGWLRASYYFCLQNMASLVDRLHNADDRRRNACVYLVVAGHDADGGS